MAKRRNEETDERTADEREYDEGMVPYVPTFDERIANSLREFGGALTVTRHDAAGRVTEQLLIEDGSYSAVCASEVERCKGRTNLYSEVAAVSRRNDGAGVTDKFSKIGHAGIIGLPHAARVSYQRQR
jgi:hypothetical protein